MQWKTDLLVASILDAVNQFEESGGTVLRGRFDIKIGKAAVVRDHWGNEYTLLDTSKGTFDTGSVGKVTGVS